MSRDKDWKECQGAGFERDVQVVCKLRPASGGSGMGICFEFRQVDVQGDTLSPQAPLFVR